MVNKEYTFTILDAAGNEVLCDTLAYIEREEENPIIIYTDYSINSNEKINLYVSELVPKNGAISLEDIDEYENIPMVVDKMHEIWKQREEENA